jgi:hypothetical protein
MFMAQLVIHFSIIINPFPIYPLDLIYGEYQWEFNSLTGKIKEEFNPSVGWLWADGSNGVIDYEGDFRGDLSIIRFKDEWNDKHYGFFGAYDFRGVKIHRFYLRGKIKSFSFGISQHVKFTDKFIP